LPRPERELNPSNPLHAFAAELRALRERAGNPKYLLMARRSGGVSRTALAEAAGGDHVPTWRTVEGYVVACGDDPGRWIQRWERLQEQMKTPGRAGDATVIDPRLSPVAYQPAPFRLRWPRRSLLLTGSIAPILAVAIVVHLATDRGGTGLGRARPTASPVIAIVVQNKVALGPSALVEDTTPVYLSSRPIPYCSRYNCRIPGTDMGSGVAVVVDCRVMGALMVNYDLNATDDLSNPNRASSSLWYYVTLPNGIDGFISEVYVESRYRGGLGLPMCSDATRVSTPLPSSSSS
jgi:hypothetical protein